MDVPSDWTTYIWYLIPGGIILLSLYDIYAKIINSTIGPSIILLGALIIGLFTHAIFRLLTYCKVKTRQVIIDLHSLKPYNSINNFEQLNVIYLRDFFSLDRRDELVKAIKNKSIWCNAWGTICLSTLIGSIIFIFHNQVQWAGIYAIACFISYQNYLVTWRSMEEYENILIRNRPRRIPLKKL